MRVKTAWLVGIAIAIGLVVTAASVWRPKGAAATLGAPASAPPRGVDESEPWRPAPALASLAGMVTAADDGQPIAGATVSVSPGPGAARPLLAKLSPPTLAVADARGRFSLSPPSAGRLELVAAAPGFSPTRRWVNAEDRGEIHLALSRGGTLLTVAIEDAGGGPIAGAVVTFSALAEAGAPVHLATDDAGAVALRLAPGAYVVEARADGYAAAAQPVVVSTSARSLSLRLRPAARIEGRVIDERGAAVPGAIVSATPAPAWAGEDRPPARTISGTDGRFVIEGLEAGRHDLWAVAEAGATPASVPTQLALGETQSDVTLVLARAWQVRGTVVRGAHATPVAGAEIELVAESGGAAWPALTTTDPSGRFTIVGVGPGRHGLVARDPGGVGETRVLVAVERGDVDGVMVTLASGGSIRGSVSPPGAAAIRLLTDPEGLTATTVEQAFAVESRRAATADEAGRFVIDDVPPGRYRVRAERSGGVGETAITVVDGETHDATIAIAPASQVVGRVVDERGAAVAGVTVRLVPTSANPGPAELGLWMLRRAHDVDGQPSGEDGRFRFDAVPPGDYVLAAFDQVGLRWWAASMRDERGGPRPLHVGQSGEVHADLVLMAQAEVVRGEVVDAEGRPIADAVVQARFAGSWRQDGRFEVMADARPEAPVLSDAAGRFVITDLRRGVYDLVAEAPGGAGSAKAERVAPGAPAHLVVRTPGALAGRVAGVGAGACRVELFGPSPQRLSSGQPECAFRAVGLAPGRYVIVTSTDAGQSRAEAEVVGGASVEVLLGPPVGGTVRGRVVDEHGAPAPGLWVVAATGEPADSAAWAERLGKGDAPVTDATGAFRLERLGPGPRTLIVLSPNLSRVWRRAAISVPAGDVVDVGTIKLGDDTNPGGS
jgi:protocatechuate 3,4-dioxygenase beta subunit